MFESMLEYYQVPNLLHLQNPRPQINASFLEGRKMADLPTVDLGTGVSAKRIYAGMQVTCVILQDLPDPLHKLPRECSDA